VKLLLTVSLSIVAVLDLSMVGLWVYCEWPSWTGKAPPPRPPTPPSPPPTPGPGGGERAPVPLRKDDGGAMRRAA
jgi:hypothetical protein